MEFYLIFDEFFLKKNIEKAMKLDLNEPPNLTSSCVDDVFFISNKSIQRSLMTLNNKWIRKCFESVIDALEKEYLNALMKRLGSVSASFVSGNDKDKFGITVRFGLIIYFD